MRGVSKGKYPFGLILALSEIRERVTQAQQLMIRFAPATEILNKLLEQACAADYVDEWCKLEIRLAKLPPTVRRRLQRRRAGA